MIPILTKHLTEHPLYYDEDEWGKDSPIPWQCKCRWVPTPDPILDLDMDDAEQQHAEHVAATFQAALDAAGATTRTEWYAELPDGLATTARRRKAEEWSESEGGAGIFHRMVVSMPWQTAEEVEE